MQVYQWKETKQACFVGESVSAENSVVVKVVTFPIHFQLVFVPASHWVI